jgi:predicted TIM-barrel fold metal-dependent hydrolase
MIIDSHTHLDVYSNKLIPLKERIGNLKKNLKKNSISKAVVIASLEEDNYHPSMKELVTALENEKDLVLIGTISIDNLSKSKLTELEFFLKNKRIRGVKLYPGYERFYPFDKKCDSVYDLCEKYDVPVIFHTGETLGGGLGMKYAKPEHIDELAVKRPNLKIIIAHLGNPWITDAMVILSRNENVYADISGLVWKSFDSFWKKYYQTEIIKVVKYCLKNKLLFGTDWPCNDPSAYSTFQKDYIKFVNGLKISKKDKEDILSGNAKKLFRI